jgi:hypothetical protein
MITVFAAALSLDNAHQSRASNNVAPPTIEVTIHI